MAQITKKSITHWLLTGLLGLVFVAAGGAKLVGVEQVLLPFVHMNMLAMAKVVGVLEIAGAIGLFVPKFRFLAALGLSGIMVGAIAYHLVLDPEKAALPGIILLMLCGILVWLNRSAFKAKLVS